MRFAKILAPIALACFGLVAEARAETHQVRAKSGATTSLGNFVSFSRDSCYSQELGDPKITQPPRNGRVQVQRAQGRLSEGMCKGERASGVQFIYTSTKGFRGADEVTVDIPMNQYVDGPGGATRSITFTITVE